MNNHLRLLTLEEFADVLRLSPHTVRKWVHDGKIHPVRICRRLLFDPAEVDRLIAESRQERSDDLHQNLRAIQ
jgi:excisionase family DNA binding protein